MKGEGQDQKEGTAIDVEGDLRGGQWVYLRDGSSLTQLLKKELDVQMNSGDDDAGR
jgi:frataxin-like iron-binding protein CyaY